MDSTKSSFAVLSFEPRTKLEADSESYFCFNFVLEDNSSFRSLAGILGFQAAGIQGTLFTRFTADAITKTAKHNQEVKDLEGLIEELTEANKELRKVNKDCISINTNIIKDHQEITRAYNGLAQMGKYVDEKVITKHNKKLPENNPDDFHEFKQKHTLLESGKVLHQWSMKRKKKVEDTND